MQFPRYQRTIATAAAVTGFGYWSGRDVQIEFRPAPANTGITFVRGDVRPTVAIAAAVENRIEAPRRTVLAHHGVRVEMVEHVMAALAGLGIDNCEIWVDAAEMPGCDGSAQPFVEALDQAGLVELDTPRKQIVLRNPVHVGDEQSWIEARPTASGALTLECRLDYDGSLAIGRQAIRVRLAPDRFRRDLAPSRTFMLKHEADQLLACGLGTRVTPNDLLVFGKYGPLGNELRFRDECVRHKALDLVGDLALAQCDLAAHVVAHRSGHRLNAELVRALLAEEGAVYGRYRCA
jgi:UDP-3-O-acyl N-acetylglucosamine deacetylase